MLAWEKNKDFRELVVSDSEMRNYLNKEEVDKLFDVKQQLKHVNTIFSRVFS